MNVSSRFDEKAAEWDKNPRRLEMARVFAGEVGCHGNLSPEKDCLEFGCGTGLVGMHLFSYVRSIVMLDTSPGMIRELEKKIRAADAVNLKPLQANIDYLDPDHHRFDLIYSLMALHHVQDISSCFRSFRRLLKPGGRLCLGDLEPEDGSFHGGNLSGIHYGFDPGAWKRELESMGFEIPCVKRMYSVTKPGPDGSPKTFHLFFLTARLDGRDISG